MALALLALVASWGGGAFTGWGAALPLDPAIGVSPTGLPVYTEVTASAGLGGFLHAGYLGPENPGEPYPYFTEISGPGACWLDHDGDGDLDLYAVNGLYQTFPELNALREPHSMLFGNLGDGTFADFTGATGTGLVGLNQGCGAADYDNDGDPDLYVTAYGGGTLLRNDGGAFTDVTEAAGVDDAVCGAFPCWSASVSWFDLDRDGCLDLFIDNYTDYPVDNPPPGNGPGPGQVNRLYLSRCDGTLADVTQAAGLVEASDSWSSVAADYDDDGWTDLYVSNDGDENDLYHNNGDGTFTRLASTAAQALSAMGTAAGDVNHDGRWDLITTNWVDQYNGIFVADGVHYLDIGGDEPFSDAYPWSGWAAHWFDLTNDGHTDLMVLNGMTETYEIYEVEQPILIYQNLDGAGTFRSVRTEVGDALAQNYVARGGAWADYDSDGDVDVVVGEAGENPLHLMRADRTGGNFVSFDLVGTAAGVTRDAIGARVTVTAPDLPPQYQEKVSGSGFMSSNDPRLHFGLAYAESVTVSVRWPDLTGQTWTDLRVNAFYRLTQGATAAELRREMPIVRIAGPSAGARLEPLTFVADVAPSAGATTTGISWDLGGEAAAAGPAATHAFPDVGTYVVRATATDSLGRAKTQAVTVTIGEDLVAHVEVDGVAFGPFDNVKGHVLVTFADGTAVAGARVDVAVERSSGSALVDTIVGAAPFLARQALGFVPFTVSGATGADGRMVFEVPYNLVSPLPAVPLEGHHPGAYTVTATGGARGSGFEPAHAHYDVLTPPPEGQGRPGPSEGPAILG